MARGSATCRGQFQHLWIDRDGQVLVPQARLQRLGLREPPRGSAGLGHGSILDPRTSDLVPRQLLQLLVPALRPDATGLAASRPSSRSAASQGSPPGIPARSFQSFSCRAQRLQVGSLGHGNWGAVRDARPSAGTATVDGNDVPAQRVCVDAGSRCRAGNDVHGNLLGQDWRSCVARGGDRLRERRCRCGHGRARRRLYVHGDERQQLLVRA